MLPLFGDPDTGTGIWHLFKHGWSTIVFGTPAVIVFFVISGFCIHLPLRGTDRFDVGKYYLRRYTRILIPVAAALLVYKSAGRQMILWGEHSILWHSPLWSLLCEEIYYALYPVLRWLRNRVGWSVLLAPCFLASVTIAARHPHAVDWHIFGPLGTAMVLLPVWLLGCLLAEQAECLAKTDGFSSIWLWRFGIWLASWILEMLHFKLGVSYTQTMVWFGVLAYFWVRQEIVRGKADAPNRYLVAAGAWSYSLYLIHAEGGSILPRLRVIGTTGLLDWFLIMASSLASAYVFYTLVERPSHKLARRIRVDGARNVVEPGIHTVVFPERVTAGENAASTKAAGEVAKGA